MSSMDSLFLKACSQGYLLDRNEFTNLYNYAKQVQQQQHQQEEEFFKARTPLAYPQSRSLVSEDWLSSLHAKIRQELAGEFPRLEEIKREKAKILEAVRSRRLNPPPPSLPELPEDSTNLIKSSLSSPPSTTLIERFCIPITPRDLRTLMGASWLNDEIINFYFEMISERSAGTVHVMNTFFYTKLKDSGYASVRRWTKKVDIFARNRVLLPVHLGVHWCMAEIDMPGKRILYYDSLHGSNELCLQLLLDWLKSEHSDKKLTPLPDAEDWQLLIPHSSTPTQQNGYDCGVFTCVTAEYRSRNAGLFFSQADMPYFRQRLAYEIVTGRLLE